ncbi:hypothetical protein [Paenibacillus aceti]|uniref:ClpX-type ZB domain-containing protein n=1 Tax=Paenibacillus aceti TaxID=1820010 RepID=A0ABQ1VSZ0_9BACL|nr:hypothetical protein [Paenibacillus aceti]GGF93651.1 hypothetical protein GCM10010913_14010 [Paenibacillus aceti]
MRSWFTKHKNDSIIKLNKPDEQTQKCSRCKRRKKLTFYANDYGVVRGLCKECRKEIGDKEELYPI